MGVHDTYSRHLGHHWLTKTSCKQRSDKNPNRSAYIVGGFEIISSLENTIKLSQHFLKTELFENIGNADPLG